MLPLVGGNREQDNELMSFYRTLESIDVPLSGITRRPPVPPHAAPSNMTPVHSNVDTDKQT
jgi:hypothetical protein